MNPISIYANQAIVDRLALVGREFANYEDKALARYNAIMNTAESQAAYHKATVRDTSKCKVRANALIDAAQTLCGDPTYLAQNRHMSKSWNKQEVAFLELFCKREGKSWIS